MTDAEVRALRDQANGHWRVIALADEALARGQELAALRTLPVEKLPEMGHACQHGTTCVSESNPEHTRAILLNAGWKATNEALATARGLLGMAEAWMSARAHQHDAQSPPGLCICDWCVDYRRIAAFLAGQAAPEAK